jgi:DNA-binding transcriptional LysR family regulator
MVIGMNLDGIDVFVRVAQANGFAAAARQLGMPTSTVSAKIARLEERLGVTLIQRSTRRMHLTEAGVAYFDACLKALSALDAGESQIAAGSVSPRGLLRLTAPADLASALVAPLAARYLALYPESRVDVVVTSRLLDLVGEGIDLAIRVGMLRDSTLISRKVPLGAVGLWASPDYARRRGLPLDGSALAAHDMVDFSPMPEFAALVNGAGEELRLPRSGRASVDDMQSVRALVAAGVGIGLLPEVVARGDDLVRVLPEFSITQDFVYFVYPAQRHVTANVRAFIDLALGK